MFLSSGVVIGAQGEFHQLSVQSGRAAYTYPFSFPFTTANDSVVCRSCKTCALTSTMRPLVWWVPHHLRTRRSCLYIRSPLAQQQTSKTEAKSQNQKDSQEIHSIETNRKALESSLPMMQHVVVVLVCRCGRVGEHADDVHKRQRMVVSNGRMIDES